MKKSLTVAFTLLVLGLSGCGSKADNLMKEQIRLMNQVADAMEKKAPLSEMDDLQRRVQDNTKKMEELKLSDEEKKKLAEKYKDDVMKVGERMMKVMVKNAGSQPGNFKLPQLSGKK